MLFRSQYLIKVNLRGLTTLLEKQSWRKIAGRPGYESATFEYKCSGWSKSRTFVAVRLLTEVIIEEDALFESEKYEYDYFAMFQI